MRYISESSLQKSFQDVQGRFCVDSNSEKSDPMFPLGRPSHASEPLSLSRSRTIQGCIRPDAMATRLDALQSSRRFQLSFAGTKWEDNLHPSEHQGNTVRTQRSSIRKLRAFTLHPSRRQGNTIWTRSFYGKYVQTKWKRLDSRATACGHGLNMEMRGPCYEKPIAQKTVRTLHASI
jgi:hypothetical protein